MEEKEPHNRTWFCCELFLAHHCQACLADLNKLLCSFPAEMAATERSLSVLLLVMMVVGMSASASKELTKQSNFLHWPGSTQDLIAEVSAPLLNGGLMYVCVCISVAHKASHSSRLFLF